jgi:hypothetical protein
LVAGLSRIAVVEEALYGGARLGREPMELADEVSDVGVERVMGCAHATHYLASAP